jgi:nucleotide-binding universal stress UspA family protein
MFRRILVAVAEAEDVSQTLETVVALAKAFKSEVTVYHARQRVIGPDEVEEQESIPQSEEFGERLAQRLEKDGVKSRVIVESIRPNRLADHILAQAKAGESDLIVIGGHHPHNLRETVFGDIGRALAHRSVCPVLLMPSVEPTLPGLTG